MRYFSIDKTINLIQYDIHWPISKDFMARKKSWKENVTFGPTGCREKTPIEMMMLMMMMILNTMMSMIIMMAMIIMMSFDDDDDDDDYDDDNNNNNTVNMIMPVML